MSALRVPSKFTLGTVQLGMNYGMANQTGKPSREEAFEVLDTAWNVGVRSLDTAVAYGDSEKVIGEYLKESKKPYFVASKFSIKGENPREELLLQVEHTKKYLESVDLYMFHSAEQLSLYGRELEEELCSFQESGLTKSLGASIYEAKDIETVLQHDWLSAIQLPMSILDTRIIESGLLDELHKRGVQVFVRSVFFQGLLCMEKAPEKYHFLEPYLNELREVAKAEQMTLMELAISFIRDLPSVNSVVLGCESAKQVRTNSVMMNCKEISAKGKTQILEIGRRIPSERAMNIVLGREVQ